MKANQDIRAYMEKKHVYMWQLALEIGCSENTMYRRFRIELPDNEKAKLIETIDVIITKMEE